jgi:hypothetical protein
MSKSVMSKSVMSVIEVLSAKFNFSVDAAVSILTTNNKKSRSKAKDVQPKKELEDLFAQLVNESDSDEEASRVKTCEYDLSPVPETVIITETVFEASNVIKPAKKGKKTVDTENDKAVKELEKEKAKEAKILKELEKQKVNEEKEAKKKASEDKDEIKKQNLLNKTVAALEKEALVTQKKEAKEQEKLDAIEAKKAAKEQEKLAAIEAKKAAKEQEKQLTKEKKQSTKEKKPIKSKSEEAETPVKVSVKRIKIGEHEYLKSESNILYNPETKEEVGLYDAVSNSINALPDDNEEELEEDEYDI